MFPVTEKSKSVVYVLLNVLNEYDVDVCFNYRLEHLQKVSDIFKLISTKEVVAAQSVILATGGVTYKFTGSTGDGLELLKHSNTK